MTEESNLKLELESVTGVFGKDAAKKVLEAFKSKTTNVVGLFTNEDLYTLMLVTKAPYGGSLELYNKKLFYEAVMVSEYLGWFFKFKYYLKLKFLVRFGAFLKIVEKAWKMLIDNTINDPSENCVIKGKLKVILNDCPDENVYKKYKNLNLEVKRQDGKTWQWAKPQE